MVATHLGRDLPQEHTDKHITPVIENTPLRRIATPAEVADGVAFLCSNMASYIAGVNLPVCLRLRSLCLTVSNKFQRSTEDTQFINSSVLRCLYI